MPIAQNILFQFVFVMSTCIQVKQLFTRLSAIYEAISHNINKCVKSIVIAPVINLVYFLYRLTVTFLHARTTAVCISRYILKINPSEYEATITGSCNCNERKLFTAAGREFRGTSDEGRRATYFPQICEARKENRGVSSKGISFKFLRSFIYFCLREHRDHRALGITNHEGRDKNIQPRINTNKHKYSLSTDSRRFTQTCPKHSRRIKSIDNQITNYHSLFTKD